MSEKKYEVRDGITNHILGTFNELDLVFAFIKGFRDMFYNELINLKIVEVQDNA